jgi:hypothetical protein
MVDLEEGIRNCVEGYKRIVGQAEIRWLVKPSGWCSNAFRGASFLVL